MNQSSSVLKQPKRVRLYGKAEQQQRAWILHTQGNTCQLCPSHWNEIDHINGDPSDNRPENVRGLCKGCNIRQRNLAHRTHSAEEYVGVSNDDVEDSLEVNRRIEPAWVEFVTLQLSSAEPIRKDVLTGNSAYLIGCSVATIARYWKKYASPAGPFELYRPSQGTKFLVRLRRAK